jgi:hypothetical protein
MSHTAEGAEAPAPPRNKPTEEFLRALRRRGRRFRKAEAARISEKQFRIRIERAVTIVARTGSDVAPACRSVGLHNMEAHKAVRALCDERKIPRRFYWGYPRWKSQVPTSVVVMPSRKETMKRDEETNG